MSTLDDIMREIEEREARNDVLRQNAKDNGSLYRVFDWDKAAEIIRDNVFKTVAEKYGWKLEYGDE